MIKFRAWDDREKEYIKDVLIGSDGQIYFDDGVATQDDLDISVEQFTGLKDVNGKDIYEGDIIEVTSQYWGMLGNRYEVKSKQGAFFVNCDLLSKISPSISVIGNVHANPELLEEDHA